MKTRMPSFIAELILVLSLAGIPGCGDRDVNQGNRTIGAHPNSTIGEPGKNQMALNRDWESNRTCTYYHEQVDGSVWKTKWC